MRKTRAGAQWFITQGIFDAEPLVKLLHDYGALCKREGVVPRKVILTFAPCGRPKTMTFIKWLGMSVPYEVERRILESESPVEESCKLLNELLVTILEQSAGSGVPIGLNVESLSIFKEEINAAHTVFQSLQATLLNSRGSPWSVRWFCVDKFNMMSKNSSMASRESLLKMEEYARELEVENRVDKVLRKRGGSYDSVSSHPGNTSDPTQSIITGTVAISALLAGFFLGTMKSK